MMERMNAGAWSCESRAKNGFATRISPRFAIAIVFLPYCTRTKPLEVATVAFEP